MYVASQPQDVERCERARAEHAAARAARALCEAWSAAHAGFGPVFPSAAAVLVCLVRRGFVASARDVVEGCERLGLALEPGAGSAEGRRAEHR